MIAKPRECLPPIDKSHLFVAYNKCRVSDKLLDRARANRALGIVQKAQWFELGDEERTFAIQASQDENTYYNVNGSCDCKDYQYRTIWCKHRLARALILYCQQLERKN